MLREFLTTHREELIRHCREKVSKRFEPAELPSVVDHGVPRFLQQLVGTLEREQRGLIERTLPEIRLASGMTKAAPGTEPERD